jgi:cell division protein ZapA (FtsZ GTPase activity inhibitor)
MKRSVQVMIQSQEYALRTDMPEDKVMEIADFVNGQIEQVLRADNTVDSYRAVVLALLNVAGIYLHAGQSAEVSSEGSVDSGQQQRLEELVGRLEDALRDPQGTLNF